MKKTSLCTALVCCLMAAPVQAGYLEDGLEALATHDYYRALPLLQGEADKGANTAKVALGQMFEKGYGVNQSFDNAARLYGEAAEAGHAPGLYHLASLYETGNGVKKSIPEAISLYRASALAGYPEAQHAMGRLYDTTEIEGEQEEGFRWYFMAARQGHADSQFRVGEMFRFGIGTEQTYVRAERWLRKAAKQGHAMAQLRLGQVYLEGPFFDGKGALSHQHVPRDTREAAKWYKAAAKQHVAEAQYMLSLMYEKGTGLPVDPRLAEQWYHKAQKTSGK